MPRKKNVKDVFWLFCSINYSQRQIVNILKSDGINVSQRTVSNVKRKIGLQRNSVKKIKFTRERPVSTPSILSRVIEKIDVEDLPSQCSIAQSCRFSQSTVSRTIKSANFVLFVKNVKFIKLTLSTTEKHHKSALRLYRQLANYRYNRRIVVLS